MSLAYQFVAPLASMTIRGMADQDLEPLIDKPQKVTLSSVVLYRDAGNRRMDADPHFIVHVPQKEDTLCFNINGEPGVVLSLVQDPDTGFSINGQLIEASRPGGLGSREGTYFGRLGIADHSRLPAGSDSSEHYTEPWLGGARVLLEGPGFAAAG
ncbi:Inter-Alpha-Trypsin Inhibitor Heavy Chain H1 [Manis pentadactyla]|nr:Inter-Alpha-Trypsin Inhibitor Heavy Chain H1 [Manis pentadactyla]